jgi:hypothetical protein
MMVLSVQVELFPIQSTTKWVQHHHNFHSFQISLTMPNPLNIFVQWVGPCSNLSSDTGYTDMFFRFLLSLSRK